MIPADISWMTTGADMDGRRKDRSSATPPRLTNSSATAIAEPQLSREADTQRDRFRALGQDMGEPPSWLSPRWFPTGTINRAALAAAATQMNAPAAAAISKAESKAGPD